MRVPRLNLEYKRLREIKHKLTVRLYKRHAGMGFVSSNGKHGILLRAVSKRIHKILNTPVKITGVRRYYTAKNVETGEYFEVAEGWTPQSMRLTGAWGPTRWEEETILFKDTLTRSERKPYPISLEIQSMISKSNLK